MSDSTDSEKEILTRRLSSGEALLSLNAQDGKKEIQELDIIHNTNEEEDEEEDQMKLPYGKKETPLLSESIEQPKKQPPIGLVTPNTVTPNPVKPNSSKSDIPPEIRKKTAETSRANMKSSQGRSDLPRSHKPQIDKTEGTGSRRSSGFWVPQENVQYITCPDCRSQIQDAPLYLQATYPRYPVEENRYWTSQVRGRDYYQPEEEICYGDFREGQRVRIHERKSCCGLFSWTESYDARLVGYPRYRRYEPFIVWRPLMYFYDSHE